MHTSSQILYIFYYRLFVLMGYVGYLLTPIHVTKNDDRTAFSSDCDEMKKKHIGCLPFILREKKSNNSCWSQHKSCKTLIKQLEKWKVNTIQIINIMYILYIIVYGHTQFFNRVNIDVLCMCSYLVSSISYVLVWIVWRIM
jgi:hypothetical protein